jgi:hypothetical protein
MQALRLYPILISLAALVTGCTSTYPYSLEPLTLVLHPCGTDGDSRNAGCALAVAPTSCTGWDDLTAGASVEISRAVDGKTGFVTAKFPYHSAHAPEVTALAITDLSGIMGEGTSLGAHGVQTLLPCERTGTATVELDSDGLMGLDHSRFHLSRTVTTCTPLGIHDTCGAAWPDCQTACADGFWLSW